MAKERIGILGGSFDPIHRGHLQMALTAKQEAGLKQVLVMPTRNPPYKQCKASPDDRWRMTVASCAMEEGLIPCDVELRREGDTYAADTLRELRARYPKEELCYILGTDAMMRLHRWDRLDEVAKLCQFLVVPRASDWQTAEVVKERRRLQSMGVRITLLNMPALPVSSSDLRAEMEDGSAPREVTIPVREYIFATGLYGRVPRIARAEEWMPRLFDALSPKRFAHSLSVAHTARRLARVHGLNPEKAEVAGFLHDCAKCLPAKEMERICQEQALTDDPEILRSGALMHSLVGAFLAASEYGVEDPEILRAIACHTTGKVDMSELDMVVFLADKIEPTRPSYPLLEQVRITALLSLPRAALMSMEGTISYVTKNGKKPHPATQAAAAWLREQLNTKEDHNAGS